MGFSAANSPPSLRAHAGSPRVLVSLRCVSASSAAWHRGVLSVPGEGRVRQRSRPWWYFASQGVKELNFSDGKRTEDQTSSLVTSRCRASSSSPARARQLHPSLGGAVAGRCEGCRGMERDLSSAPAGPRGWGGRATAGCDCPWDGGSAGRAVPQPLSEKGLLKVSLSRGMAERPKPCDFLPFGTHGWRILGLLEQHGFVAELLACSKGGCCGFTWVYF